MYYMYTYKLATKLTHHFLSILESPTVLNFAILCLGSFLFFRCANSLLVHNPAHKNPDPSLNK